LDNPTPHQKVNDLLHELLKNAQAILDRQFVGMYLFGSLTSGDFDRDSDVDVVIVTQDEISDKLFAALKAMHLQIAAIDSWCASQLKVSYIPLDAIRRYESAHAQHPHIDRGKGDEVLFMMQHDESWIVQRYVLRERGITMAGPAPETIIDFVSPDDLRQAMVAILEGWASKILDDPAQMQYRGYQSYIVLSLCRILYTLEYGTVVSKPAAARWAQEALDDGWMPLIERTWTGRHNPGLKASPDDVNGTLKFIRYALEQARQWQPSQ